jgi:hypothetical protein
MNLWSDVLNHEPASGCPNNTVHAERRVLAFHVKMRTLSPEKRKKYVWGPKKRTKFVFLGRLRTFEANLQENRNHWILYHNLLFI